MLDVPVRAYLKMLASKITQKCTHGSMAMEQNNDTFWKLEANKNDEFWNVTRS